MNRRDALRTIGSIAGMATISRLLPGCVDGISESSVESSVSSYPANFAKISTDPTWGTGWTHIVSGRFFDSGYRGLLFYNKNAGIGEFWQVANGARTGSQVHYTNWRQSWSHVVSGDFSDSPYNGVLFYDPGAGQVEIYETDGSGNLGALIASRQTATTWTHVVAGWYLSTFSYPDQGRYSSILFYNQSQRTAELWAISQSGSISVASSGTNLPSATHIVSGLFGYSNSQTSEADIYPCHDVFFYDAATGTGQTYRATGLFGTNLTQAAAFTGLPSNATNLVAGNFGSSTGSAMDLLFQMPDGSLSFRTAGLAAFEPSNGSVSATAAMLVSGNFYMADPDDHWFQDGPTVGGQRGESERPAELRKWRAWRGASTDFFTYDQNAGVGECYRKEPAPPIEDAVEGYATSTSMHAGISRPSGSVLPGETINLHISTSAEFGAYTVAIYRVGDTNWTPVTVGNFAASSGHLARSGVAYKMGPQWPATTPPFVIPSNWMSGLYVARVIQSSTHTASLDIPFVVRSATPGQTNEMLVVIPDATFENYNVWGGRGGYGHQVASEVGWTAPGSTGADAIRTYGFELSFQRPYKGQYPELSRWQLRIAPFLQWLTLQNLSADFCTARDLHLEVPSASYHLVVFPGHHEYWSKGMRDNITTFTNAGGNVAYLSANVCWWQVRFDFDQDRMICYKYGRFDPQYQANWPDCGLTTVNWHDDPVLDPAQRTTGVVWSNNVIGGVGSLVLDTSQQNHWTIGQAYWLMTDDPTTGGKFGGYDDVTQPRTRLSVVGRGAYHGKDALGNDIDALLSETDVHDSALGTAAGFSQIATLTLNTGLAATLGIFSPNGNNAVFTSATTNWTLGLSQSTSTWNAMDQITLNVVGGLSTAPRAVYGNDIGVNTNGGAWLIGSDSLASGYGIYSWNGSNWVSRASFGAMRIAVDPAGNPWLCDSSRVIKQGQPRLGGWSWSTVSGAARDIGIGANGDIWCIGTNPVGGSYGIFKWNGSGWSAVDGGGTAITVDPNGAPWICNHLGDAYRRPGGFSGAWEWLSRPENTFLVDVAAGPDGSVWACGYNNVDNRYTLHRYVGTHWARVPGSATNVAAARDALWLTPAWTAFASSTYPGYDARFAIDQRTDTRWSSQFSDPQWIYVDLGAPSYLKSVTLAWESAHGSAYQIQVSDDALSWTTVYSTTTGVGGTEVISLVPGLRKRYIRMYGTQRGTQWGYSLWDFKVDCFSQ